MRFLITLMAVLLFCVSSAFCADDTGFDSFAKSREVVATLYFQANSEELVMGEHERISATITHLRKLQNDGRMIRVEGFSSPEGDKETNFRLSFFRARTVADIIESKGLPAEVALTGYGDLLAQSDDFGKERRVEIASYLKPASLQRVKLAEQQNMAPAKHSGITQTHVLSERTINSLTIDRAIKQKLANQKQELAEKQEISGPDFSPGLSQISRPEEPIIDALTIEQAIMEKIGAEPLPPSGAVSQLSQGY